MSLYKYNCFIEVFEKLYQCNLGNIEWENFTNVTDTALYNDLYKLHFQFEPTAIEIQKFKSAYYSQLLILTKTVKDKFKLVEGANEFLSMCQQKKLPVAIATGNWLDVAYLKMKTCNLNFENIPISSTDDDYRRTEIVKTVIEKAKKYYNIKTFESITYFGDGIWDKKCCADLGINFIGIDIDNTQKLQQAGAEKVCRNFLSECVHLLT